MIIDIIRNISETPTVMESVEIDESTIYQRELMGMEKITMKTISKTPLDLFINDYIIINSQNFFIKAAPVVEKRQSNRFEYTIEFLSEAYALYDKIIMDEGATKFSYTGTPNDLLLLIVLNLKIMDSDWETGTVSTIEEPITFVFDQQSCRTALTDVAEAFGLEYVITNKTIDLVETVGQTQAIAFEYGKGKGLYQLNRRAIDSSFATVWYGYGSTQNINAAYRSGLGRLSFDDNPVSNNESIYGNIERSVTFEDIYPRRTGTVESTASIFEITDTTIDFDLNGQFLTEGNARILFKNGDLGGNEFVISAYDHGTKTVSFKVNIEESGYELPNGTVFADIGDDYTFLGIEMPSSYIDAAEDELEAKVIEHAADNSNPKISYDLVIDEKYIRTQTLTYLITPGDKIHITDTDLLVDEDIRVQVVEWPLVNPDKITAVISENQILRAQELILNDLKKNKKKLGDVISQTNYIKLLAQEINNAVILNEFNKTYIGERAVLTGAFVAGNPDLGDVAGINGSGTLADSIRFWAGESFDNRATAPFRVQQDGKVFMVAAEIQNGCKVGIFDIDTGLIKSVDYSTSSGVLISDDGFASGNANISMIPASSGLSIKGSVFGQNSKSGVTSPTFSVSDVVAGLVGIRPSELTSSALDNLRYCKGTYGAFLSSLKNIGAHHDALTIASGTTSTVLNENSHTVVLISGTTDAYLPGHPDHGRVIVLRSVTGNITMHGSGGDEIVDLANNQGVTSTLLGGRSAKLIYDRGNEVWYQLTDF